MATAIRTFRVFVSSTFTDLKAERNALHARVFPRLRKLCAERGARFQAVDLRWGVREEAALDQRTMQICLDEIARSRRASPRPNFLVLLGDRYGWRPLPAEIPSAEYEAVSSSLSDPVARRLLSTWYRKDENSVPPRHCLLPRDAGDDPKQEAADWARTEAALRAILRDAVSRGAVQDAERVKYLASATEQEVISGALQIPDASEHVFCFFRTIAGLPDDDRASDYRDIDADGRRDADAERRLRALESALVQALPANCFKYEARWQEGAVSEDHLVRLCTDVYESLSRVIRKELDELEEVPDLDREISAHAAFADERARDFVGRSIVLSEIDRYLRAGDARPFGLIGASGAGKSAVMARAIQDARRTHPEAELIARFIGATPGSSDVRSLLESLCRQIARAYGVPEAAIPTDYTGLVSEWPRLLASASGERPLIVFLDALDQLSEAGRARALAWLPAELPPNVCLVVSAMTGECERALSAKLAAENLRTLDPMPVTEGSRLLEIWMQRAGRTLTEGQRRGVLDRFAESGGSPLYLKLAFEEARRWRSWEPARALRTGIPGIVQDLLDRLSRDHGGTLVSRGLAYLAAARHGLSEDELLDLLSADTDVFRDFIARARHTPPEPRLPVVVWSRLYFDIEPYLTERAADGSILMTFYHRQLREGIAAAYLADGDLRARHNLLAQYFAAQPLFDEQTRIANLRKLSELPFQQTSAGLWADVHATLTDFDFVEAKCTHVAVTKQGSGTSAKTVYGGVYEVQEDYRYALDRFPRE